jgi:hypothetical protein
MARQLAAPTAKCGVRGPERGVRLRQAACRNQSLRKIGVKTRIVGPDLHRLLNQAEPRLRISALKRNHARQVERVGMPRFNCKGLFRKDFRFVQATRAVMLESAPDETIDTLFCVFHLLRVYRLTWQSPGQTDNAT